MAEKLPLSTCCLGVGDVLLQAIQRLLRLFVLTVKIQATEQQADVFALVVAPCLKDSVVKRMVDRMATTINFNLFPLFKLNVG